MIPTFNCADYLRQTLSSVLAQDPGAERMQIEVVDDCSTKDDPEPVVREIANGRVNFFRKTRNEGAVANFNTCIERSQGHFVHILHGDDYVAPGFYAKLGQLAQQHPDTALIASRVFFVDEQNVISNISDRLKSLESASNDCSNFYYGTAIQFAGVAVRRTFYECHGGFLPELVHTADCEMWARAVALGGGVVSPEVLAFYRVFEGNDTGRLARTAENLRDLDRLAALLASRHDDFSATRHRQRVCRQALGQVQHFQNLGLAEAAAANHDYFWKRSGTSDRLEYLLRLLKKALGQ